MSPRFAITGAVFSFVAAAGCTHSTKGHEPTSRLTEAQVAAALLASEELPGGEWSRVSVPGRDPASSMAGSPELASACSKATRHLAEQAARWGAAEIDVVTNYVRPVRAGEESLKEEIVVDSDLDAGDLGGALRRQASACRNVVVVVHGETLESSLRVCNQSRGGSVLQVIQSWSTNSGRSGSTRLAYIFRRHLLAVVTLVSTVAGADRCGIGDFEEIVAVAALKVDRLV